MFLMWFDDNKKSSLADKLAAGAEFYRIRFGIAPSLCLVSPDDMPTDPGQYPIAIEARVTVQRNLFWFGQQS